MTEIRQLCIELNLMVKAYDGAAKEFIDPLHIAWMVDSVLSKEDWPKYEEVIRARKSAKFRTFWKAYGRVNQSIAHFQEANMGIVPGDTRRGWQEKFMKDHPKEVPF